MSSSLSLFPRDVQPEPDECAAGRVHAGPTAAREKLYQRFASRIQVSQSLSRKLVSYQGNKDTPGLRWLKYKEGFSSRLVQELLGPGQGTEGTRPFFRRRHYGAHRLRHGSCKAPELNSCPWATLAARAISAASNGLEAGAVANASARLLEAISRESCDDNFSFPHVQITQHAFPEATEKELAQAREFISGVSDPDMSTVLTLACVSVLEEVSYTRKDGQFLRWDPQSGRKVSRKLHKESVPTLKDALQRRLAEIAADIPHLKRKYGGSRPTFMDGSSLTTLQHLDFGKFRCRRDLAAIREPLRLHAGHTPWNWLTLVTTPANSKNCGRRCCRQLWRTAPNASRSPKSTGMNVYSPMR